MMYEVQVWCFGEECVASHRFETFESAKEFFDGYVLVHGERLFLVEILEVR